MFCEYCGNYLLDKWKYCPYCGRKMHGKPDIFDSLFRDGISGFSIRITSIEGKKPRVRVNRLGPVKIPIEEPEEPESEKRIEKKARSVHTVLEPKGRIQQIGQHMLIHVLLPDVKEEDVDVRKLEESVEIKAYKGDKAYFRQFQVPHAAKIISSYMEGDELIVEVG